MMAPLHRTMEDASVPALKQSLLCCTAASRAPTSLSPVRGKPVHVTFDGGRLTSDAGVLLLAEIERRLGLAERLARCLADLRAPDRVRHRLTEMI
jgi:hypothetical protein